MGLILNIQMTKFKDTKKRKYVASNCKGFRMKSLNSYKNPKTYLRVVSFNGEEEISLFEEDIEGDKNYWKKYHNGTARYFELKEIK